MKFSELFQSYGSMELPTFSLSVGGGAMTPAAGDAWLMRMDCVLTSRSEAGYLTAELELDPDGKTGKSWLRALNLGATCTLSLGYDGKNKQVFSGFLYDITWDDRLSRGLMPVEAMFLDARGKLMNRAAIDAGSARTLSQAVKTAAEGAGCSCTLKSIPKEWDVPYQRMGMTDYGVLRDIADFLSYEFYVCGNELYFGPPRSVSAPVLELDSPMGLDVLRRRGTMAGQYGGVSVSGADDAGKRISYAQARASGGGYGVDKLKPTGQLEAVLPTARTMAQTQYAAKARMAESQRRAGSIEGCCLGVPELRPGRFLKISGMSEQVNGSYYLHTVRHCFSPEGYETWFEGED